MAIAAGTHLGPYEVISPLGAGGMGEVYLAEDLRLNRKVALKLLPAQFTQDEDRLRRFVREAKAASALNHPNIITIYEIGQLDGSHFIATEFIEGHTLREPITGERMRLGEVLEVAVQVASALAAAHKAGIIHRDIKPENIMVRPDGLVKVLDFGLAKLTERRAPTVDADTPTIIKVQTDPGTVMGTVSYMSPEQTRGLEVDARSDLFSLGVVLYELVTGRVPFAGLTTTDVIVAIVDKEPAPLSHHSSEVTAEFQQIVDQALRKERGERYQTAKELLADLKNLKQDLEFEAKWEQALSTRVNGGMAVTTSGGRAAVETDSQRAAGTHAVEIARTTSSAEYLISGIKQHKRSVASMLAVLVLAFAAILYFSLGHGAIDSIAVLPFINASANPTAEELSDSITDNIFNNLSQLPNLRLKSRSAVSRYRGREADPEAVGRELKVHSVLTGMVSQRGEDLSINLELVDVLHSNVLWSEQYKLKVADISAVQEEIAREISEKLRLRLSGAEKKRLEAYQLYLKGRHYWSKRTKEELQQAIKYFQQATETDAKFAPAYAGLADCYNMLVIYGTLPPKMAFPVAKAAAEKALALDETLAEAHTSLAYAKWKYDWDWKGAERDFKRALDLNPGYAPAHQFYASYLATVGRPEEAVEEAKRTQKLDPLSLISNADLAWNYYLAHKYDQAIEQSRSTLELDPNFFPAHRYLGLAYEQKAMYAEAIAELNKAATLSNGSAQMKATLAHAYAMAGKAGEARKILNELEETAKQRYVSPYDIATIYAALGEQNRAFDWLEKAYEERSGWLAYLKINPILDNLHSDPRFADLLRRIGLTP